LDALTALESAGWIFKSMCQQNRLPKNLDGQLTVTEDDSGNQVIKISGYEIEISKSGDRTRYVFVDKKIEPQLRDFIERLNAIIRIFETAYGVGASNGKWNLLLLRDLNILPPRVNPPY
jgi:hypothetical protein